MTDVDQKEDVILEEGYITKNGRSVKNDKHSEV
jgi:hypothetical protein